MVKGKKIKKTMRIFWIIIMMFGVLFNVSQISTVRAEENEPVKAIVQYDFNGNFTDSLGGSSLTSFGDIDDGKGHKNSSNNFGIDTLSADATYWQWASNSQNGGGFYIDLDKDISEEYSIGVRFSYDSIEGGYNKIIDFKNMVSDNGFYFLGGKLMYYPYHNRGSQQIVKDQIVDIIATRSKTDKKFIAYIIVNGALQKEVDVTDNKGFAIPEKPNGKPRLGFFFDDGNGEATTGGKVYSLKVWDKPITSLDAEKAMDRIPTVLGVAPTTTANNDGKIIKTTTEMEYKLSTDSVWKPVTGTEITGLSTGTYNVRYANPVGKEVNVIVPALINIELSGNPSNYTFSGGTYTYSGVTVNNNVSSITVRPTGMVGDIKVNGIPIESGTTSSGIALDEGVETTITVESIEKSNSTTYTIKVTRAKNSTISATTGNFDKKTSAQADVSTIMTLNGNTLSNIKNGETVLIADEDYTVSENTVTIKKEYLAAQEVGTTNLTFNFSAGNTQSLAIKVSDSTPLNSSINPTTGNFDKKTSAQADVSTTMVLNGNTLSNIKNGETVLIADKDYTVSENTVTIKKEYLAAQEVGTTNLTFNFSGGNTQSLAITVTNTTHSGSASGGSSNTSKNEDIVNGNVVYKNTGESIKGVEAKVTTESNGTKSMWVKSEEAIVLKHPNGTKNILNDFNKLNFSSLVTTNTDLTSTNTNKANVVFKSDGRIQVNNLVNETETKFDITYDLGNGQKITIGNMCVKVDGNGKVSLTSTLIDPYGIIKDATTGKPIEGANVTLYYANTERNKVLGKTPDSLVTLPTIEGFKPNHNKNPQVSDVNGAYGFMVFPNADYYVISEKDGYETYKSQTISVENEIVEWNFKMNKPVAGVNRLAGKDRVDTALAIAKANYTEKVSTVILSSSKDYPDALSGSVLAYKLNAPMLLVGSSDEEQQKILDYIKSNMDSKGTVYILGGTASISTDMETKINNSGFSNITRLGGSDRFETGMKIAEAIGVKDGTPIVLASSENFPDALSISSIAAINQYPILLVNRNEISECVKKQIATINPKKVFIIGLQGSISSEVESKVFSITSLDKSNVVRLGGADRYKTSLEIAKYFNLGEKNLCLASGNDFPDGLAGGVYSSNFNAPIILLDTKLSEDVKAYLKNRDTSGITIFGGEGSISKEVEDELIQILK